MKQVLHYLLQSVFLHEYICDALHDLILFVQFKKRGKHPWRSVTFILQLKPCNFTKSNTPPWVFFTFFKLYKWYQIAQNITYIWCDTKIFTENSSIMESEQENDFPKKTERSMWYRCAFPWCKLSHIRRHIYSTAPLEFGMANLDKKPNSYSKLNKLLIGPYWLDWKTKSTIQACEKSGSPQTCKLQPLIETIEVKNVQYIILTIRRNKLRNLDRTLAPN